MAHYLQDRADQGAKLATVRASASAISAIHKASGHPSPCQAPVTMDALAAIRPADAAPEASVFGLAADTVGRRIRAACRAAGLPDGYSGHSLRVGMAQAPSPGEEAS